MFSIARNLVIDRARHDQFVPIEAVANLEELNIAADVPGPNHSVAAREELRLLQSALDRLPPQCREAVVMRKIDGLSRKEIAARMGIAEITVRRHRELKARWVQLFKTPALTQVGRKLLE